MPSEVAKTAEKPTRNVKTMMNLPAGWSFFFFFPVFLVTRKLLSLSSWIALAIRSFD